MSHAILEQRAVMASNIDTLNRNVIATADIDNGNVFLLNSLSTTDGEEEVWLASTPTSGTGLTNIWMACEPEVVITLAGTKEYKGLDPDIRNFYNITGKVFTAFKPQIGDIVVLTADAMSNSIASNTYAVVTATSYELAWAAAAVSGLSLKLIETTYISLATGAINNQRVTAYRFEVVAVA